MLILDTAPKQIRSPGGALLLGRHGRPEVAAIKDINGRPKSLKSQITRLERQLERRHR